MWRFLRRRGKRVFLCHSCADHDLVHAVAGRLARSGAETVIDPFRGGDDACLVAEENIKGATHFILFRTARAADSPWVRLESLFARHCAGRGGVVFVPANVDLPPPAGEVEPRIHVNWRSADGPEVLAERLAAVVRETAPERRLPLDVPESDRWKDRGRELERLHFRTGDWKYNLEAIGAYERAVDLNLSSHNAWANLAWCLWKQREDRRARHCIEVAETIRPAGNHVKDVADRIRAGKRSMQ